MRTTLNHLTVRLCGAVFACTSISFNAFSQTETFPSGSIIVNMGVSPQTINNSLRPYGMIYDLIRNQNVPVKWAINTLKVKDGTDFTYNGKVYRGGPFIIDASYRTPAVNALMASWVASSPGMDLDTVGATPLTVTITATLKAIPKWTLDAANGAIAQGYLTNAGITNSGFSANAYNWKTVSTLDCCDDFFVMPHADPTWATHGRLFSWNKDCLGSIWAACHAVSALENSINPSNPAEQMNFLSTRTATNTPTPWPNNSLKLWGTHSAGSVPYTHQLPGSQVAQYIGSTDLAQLNGSEQIYIPKQSTDAGGATRWRPETNIVAYDPSQVDVPSPNLANGNVAALIVYGRGMGANDRGYVMYEAGHSHNKGTANDIAAQRAFWNFSFFQLLPKAPTLTVTGITSGQIIPGTSTITGLNVVATSPLAGITFTYQWVSSCGGSFSNPGGATTNFTAPAVGVTTSCVITCKVTDNCGRASYESFPVTIKAANPPSAVNDAVTLDPGCSGNASVTYNVLANDSDPDGGPLTLTNVTGNTNGTLGFTAGGNVTYTAPEGYTGTQTLTCTVCDNTSPTPLCSNSTFTITVGDPNKVPSATNDAVTIAEDNIAAISVLANDVQSGGYTGGTRSVRSVTSGPSNGRVSVNTDNTITYIPNADFAGTDNFTYEVINTSGYRRTATVTVTVTNDACDGGTYQVGSASATTVSGNDWSKVYTRPVNTGGTNLTNTTAYSINAGSNRLLVVAISAGGPNNPAVLPTVTWGGQSLTSLSVNRTDNNRAHSFIFYLKESGIAAASGNNLIVNMGTPNYYGYVVYAAVYQSVDQTTTVRNGVSPNVSGSAINTPITATTTANFTAGDQGIFVTGYSVNNGTEVASYSSVSANWTGSSALFGGATSSSGSVGPYYGGVGVRSITTAATNETVSMTATTQAGGALRPSITVTSIIPSGASCAAIPGRAPLANPDYGYTTNSVTPLVISDVKNNDSDDGAFNVTAASIVSGTGAVGSITNNGFTFTPTSGVTGTVVVQYTISDGTNTDVAYVTITVTNAPISAANDISSGNSGTSQNINVMSNDIDPENQKGVLTIVTPPANGTAVVNDNGTPANYADDFIVYTPNTGYSGPDNFTYQVCEALPASSCPVTPFCATATVNITVVNRPPVAVNDSKNALPCVANIIRLVDNDTDPENGTLTVTNLSALSNPAAGTLVNTNDGAVTFTPTPGFSGSVTFTYTVTDDGVPPLTSAPATVTINVNAPVNQPPVAQDDAESGLMNNKVFVSVRDNDSDPDGNPLTLPVITVNPANGTATVLPNGLVEYTPNPGFAGTDVFTYQVCDQATDINCGPLPPLCDPATVTITIDPVPETDNKAFTITPPSVGQFITLNGGANPPVLSGSDPVDCPVGCVLTTRTVLFQTVPANTELYYNGVLVTPGLVISGFNPALLQVKFTAASVGTTSTSFQYSFVNAAGNIDASPATYQINWSYPLPVTGLVLTAGLRGNSAVLNWKTETEVNTSAFQLERGTDNRQFAAVGSQAAAGNSSTSRNYSFVDDISLLQQESVIYYRVRQLDIDGRFAFSNVAMVRLNKTNGVQAWPNPFTGAITININSPTGTALNIRLLSASGQVIRLQGQAVPRGTTQLTLRNLEPLPGGIYLLQVEDQQGSVRYAERFVKE